MRTQNFLLTFVDNFHQSFHNAFFLKVLSKFCISVKFLFCFQLNKLTNPEQATFLGSNIYFLGK